MRIMLSGLLLVAVATLVAAPHREGATFDDPERWAERWDSPERNEWQLPSVVMRQLALDRGDRVADIGAGTGYFTRLLGWAVGQQGRVYAVDIEPKMLAHIESRDDLSPYDNIVTVLAEPDDPKLPAGELDLILTVNTWHHIEPRVPYLRKLARALTPHGRLVVIDWHEGELPEGPPAGHKISRQAAIEELRRAGWTLVSESVALPYQYFLVLTPPRS